MDRREFLRQLGRYGLAAGAALAVGRSGRLVAQSAPRPAGAYDLVAVKGGEPGVMFDRGIAAFGGMGRFVRRGQSVLIKPNISFGSEPGPTGGANTHPLLVKRIVEHCFDAGASRVYVFDNSIQYWKTCYERSGIERAAKEAGATVVPAKSEAGYQLVQVPGARALRTTKVHELYVSCDVVINVPVLKHHSSTSITSAMKNLMGAVWDRNTWHFSNLHQCIADFPLFRRPTLNVVDAYQVLMSGGPQGYPSSRRVRMRMQLLSPDIVAVDAAAAKTWGIEPERVAYIAQGAANNLGSADLNRLAIDRITL